MKEKEIIHDPGPALSERQSLDVDDRFLKMWNEVIEPSMIKKIEITVEGALNNRSEINELNRGLGKFKFIGVTYFKTTIAANLALIIATVTALILMLKL